MAAKLKAIERTAYHEAGHALASYLLHRPFSYVTITPKDDYLGLVQVGDNYYKGFRPDIESTPNTQARIEREVMVLLAGAVAVGIATGKHGKRAAHGTGQDFQAVVHLAGYVSEEEGELSAYIQWLWLRVKNMLELPPNRAALDALAQALLAEKRIGYQRARRLMNDSLRAFKWPTEQGAG